MDLWTFKIQILYSSRKSQKCFRQNCQFWLEITGIVQILMLQLEICNYVFYSSTAYFFEKFANSKMLKCYLEIVGIR